jgi:cytochrome b561
VAEPTTSVAASILAGDDTTLKGPLRYDGFAITLHWLTAILVVTLFSLAHIWGYFPHDGPVQITMQTLHVTLGVMLAAVLVVRLAWRTAFGRRLPHAGKGLVEYAARGMHYVLYALLIAMVIAGFGKRWSRGHGLEFFVWHIPAPLPINPAWRPVFNAVHHWGAWAIITLAGLHAAAALYHHFILHDNVLKRMWPGKRRVAAH